MSHEIRIRTVTVELLRAGPPHNQLLSPLTQYLGLCGDSGAGLVSLPYEHRTFERRLQYLRYAGGSEESDRRAHLRDTGVDMAKILGAVPGLPGSLTTDSATRDGHDPEESMIHLRLVLSASELALLPFELSKVPVGPDASNENWLALQTRPPVCITRHIRTVSTEGVRFSTRPRILFVAGAPRIPYARHRELLLEAIDPWFPTRDGGPSPDDRRQQYGDLLTILKDATYEDVERECADGSYTHVHVLAHGAVDPRAEGTSFGLALFGRKGEVDVVSGERFRSALCNLSSGRVHHPDVVTVASCDSGNVGSVITPGASFAHTLHQAGIPLVVASQFPLSKEGSVSVARTLYRGLLRGKSPWRVLHQARSELHGRHATQSHDWASLVVYEALPADLGDQLEGICYHQSNRAINVALGQADDAVREEGGKLDAGRHERLVGRIEQARQMLPLAGPFAMECLGLRASSLKRQARTEFNLALAGGTVDEHHLDHSLDLLDRSFLDYRQATLGFLVNEGRPLQRIASLHWVLVQMLALAEILGKDTDEDAWAAAKVAADVYLTHADVEERAWAHGSLAELWLLRIAAAGLRPEQRAEAAAQACRHAAAVVDLFPGRNDFPVQSTARQFQRYIDWWGSPEFAHGLRRLGVRLRSVWTADGGIVDTAGKLVQILDPRASQPPPRRSRKASPARTEEEGPLAAAAEEATPPPVPAEKTAAGAGSRRRSRKPAAALPPLLRKSAPPKEGPLFEIEMLPAGHGDSLWIEYGDPRDPARVLIDCGTTGTYRRLRARLEQLPDKGRQFDLFVMTHIDADHIGGAIPFFNKGQDLRVRFRDLWFNGYQHLPSALLGAKQGEIFSTLIRNLRLPWNAWRDEAAIVVEEGGPLPVCTLPGGMKLTLLSPTPEKLEKLSVRWEKELRKHGLTPGSTVDYQQFLRGTPSTSTDVDELADAEFRGDHGAPNGSSIGFLAEFEGKSALLVGDAHSPQLVQSVRRLLAERGLEKLAVDAMKVSHHASQNNLDVELLQLLDCDRYLISTDGAHFHHPDREAVARLIKYGGAKPSLFFNFKSEDSEVWERANLQEKYGYSAIYPSEERSWLRGKDRSWQGLLVSL